MNQVPRLFILFLFSVASLRSTASPLTGGVIDAGSRPIAFSSVYIKGSSKGTTANAEGRFTLELTPGTYILYCTHVGYEKVEQQVTISEKPLDIFFRLFPLKIEMKEVVVRANGEDPAYAIIRKAIKTRNEHLNEVKQWQVDVYIKGLIKSLQVPKSVLGVKVTPDRNVIDSNGKGIVYLSESITKYSRRLPDDYKEEIQSAKVSGSSQGFGFNSPKSMEVNLYENNISIQSMNSRGFVSPISNNALTFYNYKYEGTFYEDGVEINKIKVMPKRKYEPCFAGGYINIIEGNWRIHGIDLYLTKESQIEIVDSLVVQQQMIPVNNKFWMPQQTTFFASFGIFGFKANANFNAVHSEYNLDYAFPKKFFNNVIRTADTSASKSSLAYWDKIRPVPLTEEEHTDYLKKDTLEQKYKDPAYLDSIDRKRNQFSFSQLLFSGYTKTKRATKMRYRIQPITEILSYNTVEGAVLSFSPHITHYGDTGAYSFTPSLRYGFSNKRLQASATLSKTIGKDFYHRWNISISGGRDMVQINPQNPITVLSNTISTLLYNNNYMKLYEKTFASLSASRELADGLTGSLSFNYEKRHLPDNADTTYHWRKVDKRRYTNNYPEDAPQGLFPDHQAFIGTLRLRYQPGQKYIQYPNRHFSIGSDLPVFTLIYTHGFKNTFGSDVDFDKWKLTITDELNFKLAGKLNYRIGFGGFINNKIAYLPDATHFIGNQTLKAAAYVQSFQLAPYYYNTNFNKFFTSVNLEHHFNGVFTNKIPFVRKLNLDLIAGTNSLYVNKDKYYSEIFVGVGNILKVLRADFVWGYKAGIGKPQFGFVLGFGGIFTGNGIE
ncbi:MAG: DUF5686 and carboxypeptidase regulatory-like domain-containing protein [Chitinophagaceae bacterium]